MPRMSMKSCPSLLAAAALLGALLLAGCANNTYVPITTEYNLDDQQRLEVLAQAHQLFSLDPDENQIGAYLRWIPLLHLKRGINRVHDNRLAPGADRMFGRLGVGAQWIHGKEVLTFGPLGVVFAKWKSAFFEMDGANVDYSRTTLALWGVLWLDHKSRQMNTREQHYHCTGFFFSAFGYERDQRRERVIKSIRIFWIPVPYSWN